MQFKAPLPASVDDDDAMIMMRRNKALLLWYRNRSRDQWICTGQLTCCCNISRSRLLSPCANICTVPFHSATILNLLVRPRGMQSHEDDGWWLSDKKLACGSERVYFTMKYRILIELYSTERRTDSQPVPLKATSLWSQIKANYIVLVSIARSLDHKQRRRRRRLADLCRTADDESSPKIKRHGDLESRSPFNIFAFRGPTFIIGGESHHTPAPAPNSYHSLVGLAGWLDIRKKTFIETTFHSSDVIFG